MDGGDDLTQALAALAAALQWDHRDSAAETAGMTDEQKLAYALQWGHRDSAVEIWRVVIVAADGSSAATAHRRSGGVPGPIISMGPP